MAWYTEGEKNTPSSGTILADTGEIAGQSSAVNVVMTSTVAATVIVQHRNAANDGNLASQTIKVLASATQPIFLGPVLVGDSGTERIRVVTSGAVIGMIQASITI